MSVSDRDSESSAPRKWTRRKFEEKGGRGVRFNGTDFDRRNTVRSVSSDQSDSSVPLSPSISAPWCESASLFTDNEHPSDLWDRKNVLSLDGGGIQALSELYFLRYLMKTIARLETAKSSRDSPLFRFRADHNDLKVRSRVRIDYGTFLPCQYFDYIGGSGVGGLIAVMLGRLRLSVDEAIDAFRDIWTILAAGNSGVPLYDRMNPFAKAKTINSKSMGIAVDKVLEHWQKKIRRVTRFTEFEDSTNRVPEEEKNRFAMDGDLCRTLVLVMPDRPHTEDGMRRLMTLRSYAPEQSDTASYLEGGGIDMSIKDVLLATSASPGLFKRVKINGKKYRDGTEFSHSPEVAVCKEVWNNHQEEVKTRPIRILVSLGSGQKRSAKWLGGKVRSQDNSSDASADNDMPEVPYRFSGPEDLSDIELDPWRMDVYGDETFLRIEKSTEFYCEKRSERIQQCARDLIALRERRANTSHWERYALGIRYECQTPSCQSKRFDDREYFIFHLLREHGHSPPDPKHWDRIQDVLASSQRSPENIVL